MQPEKRILSETMADAINGLQLRYVHVIHHRCWFADFRSHMTGTVPAPASPTDNQEMSDASAGATVPSASLPPQHRRAVRLRPAPCTALVLYVEASEVIAESLRRPSSADSPQVVRAMDM